MPGEEKDSTRMSARDEPARDDIDRRAGRVRSALVLAAILALGLALAGFGVDWGLPSHSHYQSYHGGESRAVGIALQMDLSRLELEPRWRGKPFFRWGSHALYAFHIALWTADLLGALEVGGQAGDWSVEQFARAHWIARSVSVAYTLGTIALVFAAAGRWYGWWTGAAAGLFTALCPLLAYQARFATSDPCLTFWCTAALLLCVRAATRSARHVAIAGAAIGLAVGAKLSALPLLALGLCTVCWGGTPRSAWLARSLALSGGILGGFFLCTPYALVHPREFFAQALSEVVEHSQAGHGLVFADTGNGIAYLLLVNLPVALYWPLWGLCLCGAGLALARSVRALRAAGARDPARIGEALCILWIALMGLALAQAQVRYVRYLMPICPFLCLLAAMALRQLLGRAAPRAVWLALLALVPTGLYSAAHVAPFGRTDPKDLAYDWFCAHVEPGASVGFLKRPSHLTPPLYPEATVPGSDSEIGGSAPLGDTCANRYSTIVLGGDPRSLQAAQPDYVVVNTLEVREELRLDPRSETVDPELAALAASVRVLWADVQAGYELASDPFRNEARLLGLDFSWETPPRGWIAATQEIRIYRRKPAFRRGRRRSDAGAALVRREAFAGSPPCARSVLGRLGGRGMTLDPRGTP
jgi:4-amino-4-deoxy-L-arabinose transferase-like glycosyltransferase